MGNFDVKKTEAYAELEFRGTKLDVETISCALGLPIDRIRLPGDFSDQSGTTVCVFPSSEADDEVYWTYRTQPKNVYDLSELVDDLIAVFGEKTDTVLRLKEKYNAKIVICPVLYNHQSLLPGISLSAEQIAFLATIGADLDIDIYHNQQSQ